MRVIEQERGRYEVQEVPYGKVYSWHPGRARVECDCGAILTWEGPGTVCECGAECDEILESSGFQDRSDDHPWLREYREWREQEEAKGVRCEYYTFVGVDNGA